MFNHHVGRTAKGASSSVDHENVCHDKDYTGRDVIWSTNSDHPDGKYFYLTYTRARSYSLQFSL
jgi:hypothetical protein